MGKTKNLRPPWPKGVSGNPTGNPPIAKAIHELKRLNREAFEKMVNELIHLSVEELERVIKDKKQQAFKIALAAVLAKAMSTGDYSRVDFFLNRLIGKVPDKFEGANGEPVSFVGLIQLAHENRKKKQQE